METLEKTLADVNIWARGLHEQFVVQEEEVIREEKSHYEDDGGHFEAATEGSAMSDAALNKPGFNPDEEVWVPHTKKVVDKSKIIGKPRITKPNDVLSDIYTVNLAGAYNDSEWYSARYLAGRILNMPDLDKNLDSWMDKLCKEYDSIGYNDENKRTSRVSHIEQDMVKLAEVAYGPGGYIGKCTRVRNHFILDSSEKRERFCKLFNFNKMSFLREEFDSGRELNRDEIMQIYQEYGISHEQVSRAGKQLGYSAFKIWTHENKTRIEQVIGCVGIGLGILGSYLIYHYLSR